MQGTRLKRTGGVESETVDVAALGDVSNRAQPTLRACLVQFVNLSRLASHRKCDVLVALCWRELKSNRCWDGVVRRCGVVHSIHGFFLVFAVYAELRRYAAGYRESTAVVEPCLPPPPPPFPLIHTVAVAARVLLVL
ncbi:hypothetical protein LX36DRAFT_227891 [Colletotrichum falcatum]|nr:hypothetical protein LX36DRAFT_227891 [Colletotrichum falcatum]